jgi:uncharacterized RDD family membrane protein YckC
MQWYYEGSKKQVGPISEEDFQALIKDGTINNSTLVWNSTMTEWKKYGELNGTSAQSAGSATSICAECGRGFLKEDMIKYGDSWVCSQCKPVFIQKIKEGINVKQMDYAGFWIRFGAVIIDLIIIGVFNSILNIILISIGVLNALTPNFDQSKFIKYYLITVSINMATKFIYEVFFVGKWGATIGKMACGLKIVTADSDRVTYLRSFARYFGEIVSNITLGIGYILAAFDDEKRTLHDRICSTRVIRK